MRRATKGNRKLVVLVVLIVQMSAIPAITAVCNSSSIKLSRAHFLFIHSSRNALYSKTRNTLCTESDYIVITFSLIHDTMSIGACK